MNEQAPKTAEKPDVDAQIEAWWEHHFHGSELGANTRLWNYAHAAKEDLKARLKKFLG